MGENGYRSPRFRRLIFWLVSPLAVVAAVSLPMLVSSRALQALAAVAAIDAGLILLLLALWDPNRFLWAGRTVAAMIFIAYLSYLGWAIFWPTKVSEKSGRRLGNSVVPAVGGFILIGWPALMFALYGRFSLHPTIDDSITPIANDDPLWLAALQRARETIPILRELHLKHKGEIAVKFPFRTDKGETEHLWGRLLDIRERDMWLTVLTPPIAHDGIRPEHVKVSVADLEDWQLDLPDGKVRGGFSTKAQMEIYRRDRRVLPLKIRDREKDFVDA
jgi:uncharacterized protein YegJ (DUF2314 family)